MHTVDLLVTAMGLAKRMGIHVREEWLDGASGGECEIAGERWLFLDLSQPPQERLHAVAACLASHPPTDQASLPRELHALLKLHRAA